MIEALGQLREWPLTDEDVEIYLLRVPARTMLAYRRAHRGDSALMFMATDEASAFSHVEQS